AAGDGIDGHGAQIALAHQVLQRLRGLLLVEGVLVDHRAQREQIVLEQTLLGAQQRFLVERHGDRHQNRDDRHYDDQLDQRVALFTTPNRTFHRARAPWSWYRRRKRSALPSFAISDRPACCACPSRMSRSSGPWGCAAEI